MTDAEKLFDAVARVENIIWIPGAVSDFEGTPDSFREEFCENLPEKEDSSLYTQLPILRQFADNGYDKEWEIAECLINTPGFLIQAATPVMTHSNTGSSSYGWGYYRTEWLYAKDEHSIANIILDWVKTERDRERNSALDNPNQTD